MSLDSDQIQQIAYAEQRLKAAGLPLPSIRKWDRLCSLARSIGRLDVADCCVELTDNHRKRGERMLSEVRALGLDIGAEYVYHQGDPRGAPIYLLFPGDVRDSASSLHSCYTNGIAFF